MGNPAARFAPPSLRDTSGTRQPGRTRAPGTIQIINIKVTSGRPASLRPFAFEPCLPLRVSHGRHQPASGLRPGHVRSVTPSHPPHPMPAARFKPDRLKILLPSPVRRASASITSIALGRAAHACCVMEETLSNSSSADTSSFSSSSRPPRPASQIEPPGPCQPIRPTQRTPQLSRSPPMRPTPSPPPPPPGSPPSSPPGVPSRTAGPRTATASAVPRTRPGSSPSRSPRR